MGMEVLLWFYLPEFIVNSDINDTYEIWNSMLSQHGIVVIWFLHRFFYGLDDVQSFWKKKDKKHQKN